MYCSFDCFSFSLFNKYRDLSSEANKMTTFSDCARFYNQCEDAAYAEKHNQADEEINVKTVENYLNEGSERQ